MYIFEYYRNEIASMIDHSSQVKFWWDRHDEINGPYVVYQTEDLIHSHKRDEQYMRFLSNAEKVYDYSTVNLKYHNGEFRPYLPKIHSKAYDGYKDIDVLFYGGMSDRRREIINQLSSRYTVTYIDRFNTLEEHIDAVRRSNYVLSIGYYDNNYNDFWRVTPALDFGGNILLEENFEMWSLDFLKRYFNNRITFI
jgi:hypothetical protein